jgi:hypothetical protein
VTEAVHRAGRKDLRADGAAVTGRSPASSSTPACLSAARAAGAPKSDLRPEDASK